MSCSNHVNRLLVAKGLRAFGDGYVSLLLPLYLLQLGFSPLQVGIIATATQTLIMPQVFPNILRPPGAVSVLLVLWITQSYQW